MFSDVSSFKKTWYLKKIYFCGEMFINIMLKKYLKKKNIEIINSYGPTEGQFRVVKFFKFKNYKKFYFNGMSIGKPIKNMNFSLKKIKGGDKMKENCLYRPQVAEGYFNDQKLNNKKFIKKNKIKFYHTGDIILKKKQYYFKLRMIFKLK